MILEKLTVDEVSFIFFACSVLSFFAISLFNIIVRRSAMKNLEHCSYFEYPNTQCLQTSQRRENIPIYGNNEPFLVGNFLVI